MQKPLTFILLLFVIVIVVAFAGVFFGGQSFDSLLYKNYFNEHTIYVHDDVPINVAIADTPAERQRGLGGKDMMAPGQGMLFVFDESKKWRIWMKDMNFGIDILWLDKNGKIVDMRTYVYPDTYNADNTALSEVFEPQEPAWYVLEVIAGFSDANGIRIGDVIKLGL